ncbi:MAG: hypothetical protein Q9181_007125 [Wetmoreana brouardii]
MRWPWSSSSEEREEKASPSPNDVLSSVTDWSRYQDPRNVIPVIVLTAGAFFFSTFYRSYLKRVSQAINIAPTFWRKRSLFGRVTSVGDNDNFRLFHTPGGRLAGWEILPWRRVPTTRKQLAGKTVHIRLAGIDAPELPHFGRPAQPYSKEAMDFLTSYILHRRVRAYVHHRDQYDRAVATVYVRRWLIRRDVGLQMLKRGLATVFEANSGAEYGGMEEKYRSSERQAKSRRKGMWGGDLNKYESPMDFKKRMGPKHENPVDFKKGTGRITPPT